MVVSVPHAVQTISSGSKNGTNFNVRRISIPDVTLSVIFNR